MKERIKYLALVSIPFYGVITIYSFLKEDFNNFLLFISLFIFSTVCYLFTLNKKIKVDKNNNAVKKQK